METKTMGGEDENIKKIRSVVGTEFLEPDILRALSQSGNDPDAAINHIVDTTPITVKRTVTSTGARISTQIKQENSEESGDESIHKSKPNIRVKEESDMGFEVKDSVKDESGRLDCVQKSVPRMSFDEFLRATNTKVMSDDEYLKTQIEQERSKELEEAQSIIELKPEVNVKEEPDMIIEKVPENGEVVGSDSLQSTETKVVSNDECAEIHIEQDRPNESEEAQSNHGSKPCVNVKEEPDVSMEKKVPVKEELMGSDSLQSIETKVVSNDECAKSQIVKQDSPKELDAESCCGLKEESYEEFRKRKKEEFNRRREEEMEAARRNLLRSSSSVKKERVEDKRLSTVVIEDGDFPEEKDWLLVGRNVVTGLSTTRGRKLEDNEIVHFSFPSGDSRSRHSSQWVSAKAAAATSGIVRFSTKRSGEVISFSFYGLLHFQFFIILPFVVVY